MAEELNLDHFDLGTFVDYVHALKQERDALRAQLPSQGGVAVVTDAFVPGSLADLLFQLGEKGIQVSGGTHGDHWAVALPGASVSVPVKSCAEQVEILAHLYMGAFSAGELGEIDIDLVTPNAERLQQELVLGEDVTLSLMTVAQHQRIMAAATHPADQVAEPDAELVALLRNKFPRIDPCKPVPLDEKAHCCEYTIYVERERLHRLIDAKLASLKP